MSANIYAAEVRIHVMFFLVIAYNLASCSLNIFTTLKICFNRIFLTGENNSSHFYTWNIHSKNCFNSAFE